MAAESTESQLILHHQPPPPSAAAAAKPKRFIRNQIPDSILHNAALNAAIALLPSNYNFEVHKCVHRILAARAARIALQFPEGLLMYSLHLSDIFLSFAGASHCFVLGDVTYGACCVDDFSASALDADLLIHYGHSCLVTVDTTIVPCLYVFVEIRIDVGRMIGSCLGGELGTRNVVLAGTIQFGGAIRAAKAELERVGFRVLVPQAKPLSAGEVLGCTAPRVLKGDFDGVDLGDVVVVFVADGRFHLEAFMIANPGVRAYRYDPYLGKMFLEEYDHVGMKDSRRKAIERAREAKNWGVVLGTLGRQGNLRILDRLEKKMGEKRLSWAVVLMSEMSPARIALFEDSIDAWIQIACPRLSVDWGESYGKPLLNSFEAEIALGLIPGWWEKKSASDMCGNGECCACDDGAKRDAVDDGIDYPMDYYAQDGGEWNSCYSKRRDRPAGRSFQTRVGNGAIS